MMGLLLLDDPYSLDQLRDPRMNISVVRPLVDKLYDLDDVSIGMPFSTCNYNPEEDSRIMHVMHI